MAAPRSFRLLQMLLLPLIAITGCTVQPYDYSALKAAKPHSILVMPPVNNSLEVDAPYTFLATISRPLAEKGYYVFPVVVIDQFLKENGLPTPLEMQAVPLEKIREIIGPDAVLYVTIEDWGQHYQLISSQTVVSSRWRLVDARTGTVLWEGVARAVMSPGDSGAGLAGALIAAVVNQVVGSVVDQTPELSRQANSTAINDRHRGLLPGPYGTRQLDK
ncbi:MAG: DUF799 domain-containing protein [Desulfopila sp.]